MVILSMNLWLQCSGNSRQGYLIDLNVLNIGFLLYKDRKKEQTTTIAQKWSKLELFLNYNHRATLTILLKVYTTIKVQMIAPGNLPFAKVLKAT